MQIAVDHDRCLRYAQCTLEAPEVFELPDDGPVTVRPDVPDSASPLAQTAAELCPMQAITVEE